MNTTDFLETLGKNDCYIEEAGDVISIRTQDGRDVRTPHGFLACPVPLPRAIFDQFIAASLITPDGPKDSEGRTVFRLTSDGRARAAA